MLTFTQMPTDSSRHWEEAEDTEDDSRMEPAAPEAIRNGSKLLSFYGKGMVAGFCKAHTCWCDGESKHDRESWLRGHADGVVAREKCRTAQSMYRRGIEAALAGKDSSPPFKMDKYFIEVFTSGWNVGLVLKLGGIKDLRCLD